MTDGILVAADLRPMPGPGEVRIVCPSCKSVWVGPRPERATPSAFCPNPACDYPLFLAVGPVTPPMPETDDARWRLPGVDGKEPDGVLACPWCGEPNPPKPEGFCLRCHEPLTPPTPPPPPPPPAPDPATVTLIEYVQDPKWKIIAAVTGGLLFVATVSLIVLIWIT